MTAPAHDLSPLVAARLEQWRRRLLDMSRSNRLLYFRTERSGMLRLTAPGSSAIYDRLVNAEGELAFYLPDLVGDEADDSALPVQAPLPFLPLEPEAPPPLRPGEVRAEADPKKLHRILYRLRQRARSSLEERGVNTLYVAFGMLHYKETSGTSEIVRSPLLLVPVSLKRESALERYRLAPFDDEEMVLNPTLVERLVRDFGVKLTLPEWEEDPSLSEALASIGGQVPRQSTWTITDDVYLGHFSFLKLVMYNDLKANATQLAEHPIVHALLTGDAAALPPLPPDLPTEANLDTSVAPAEIYHILDADSSQLEALVAVDRGANVIVQGPPGTGKSQSIANVIAQALARGRRVLFVSEKMAALEVVYRRLADAGLDSFCLELHSHHANKKAVLAQLDRAFRDTAPGPTSAGALLSLEELSSRRSVLNSYAAALNDVRTPLDMSVFQAHAEVAQRYEAPELRFTNPPAGGADQAELGRLTGLVGSLAGVGDVLLGQDGHPWRGTRVSHYSLQTQGEIRARFSDLQEAVDQASALGAQLAGKWGLPAPTNLRDLRWLLVLLELLVANPVPLPSWLGALNLMSLVETARAQAERCAGYERRRAALLAEYDASLLVLDHADLRARLTEDAAIALAPLRLTSPEPAETASAQHATLARLLDRCIAALEAVLTVGPDLAARAGLVAPGTTVEVRAVARAVGYLLRDHRPPVSWLNRPATLARRALAMKAREHASTWRVEGQALAEHYDLALLREAGDLRDRYAHYGSFLRLARPGYWRDSGRLKQLSRARKKPDVATAKAVLTDAQKVGEARAWFDRHEVELAQSLAPHRAFRGEDTDWDAIVSAVDTSLAVLEEFGEAGVPAAYARLLSTGGVALYPLRAPHRLLVAALADLDAAAAELECLATLDEVTCLAGEVELAVTALRAWREALTDFWEAEEVVRRLRHGVRPRSVEGLVADLVEAQSVRDLGTALAADAPRLAELFGRSFSGLTTDWPKLLAALEWTGRVREHFRPGAAPTEFVTRVASPERYALPPRQEASELAGLLRRVDSGLTYVLETFEETTFQPGGRDPESADLSDLSAWLSTRLNFLGGLEGWLDFVLTRQKVVNAGLGGFVADLERLRAPVATWRDAFLKRFYQLWLDARYASVPELREFRARSHEGLIEEFRQLDRQAIQRSSRRIREEVLGSRPAFGALGGDLVATSEPAILYRELSKRKRHKPIRRLFTEIPNLLLTLKPCLMMSPLSVSQYLDSERLRFDLVIFDEASQVMPEDAVGSVFRGTQVVIAGDQKQLPPTRFFERQLGDGDDEEEEEAGEVMESILDQCASIGMPSKPLRWHYRSRDERLIAFSNRYFYGGSLITFPSPDQDRPELGVQFVHVPEGIYDRGGSRTNRVEARHVVDLVLRHAEGQLRRPEPERRSLGVVAFSSSQMDAIHQELERTRRQRPELEAFFREDRAEPFFVKNLETVQGDERDVIFFSLGYGRDAAGRLVYNFGPLIHAGGERRLNVAVSRAREHVKFISSIHPSDLDLTHLSSDGARLLRNYMDFALRGPEALAAGPARSEGSYESVFEEAVGTALEKKGLTVHRQVGCAGYRIDLAVADPEHVGRHLLGIECDGATYHRSKTARDRDRLRQQVLEGLGWRIHRVWSQDWVKDPERETRRIIEAVERARQAQSSPLREPVVEAPTTTPPAAPPPTPVRSQEPPVVRRRAAQSIVPYAEAELPRQRDRDSFYRSTSNHVIAELVAGCVEVEWPVHESRVIEVVASCWGFERVGDLIKQRVRQGIDRAVDQKLIERRDEFLWKPGQAALAARVRSGGPGGRIRHIRDVAVEELSQAAMLVVEDNFSLPAEDLVVQTARLLGYDRTGSLVEERVRSAIEVLTRQGLLVDNAGLVSRSGSGASRRAPASA